MKTKEYFTEDHTLDLSNECPDPEYFGIDYAKPGSDKTAYWCNGVEISKEEYDELLNEADEIANCEQYRKDTEKMHWLDQKWQKVYKQIKQTGE